MNQLNETYPVSFNSDTGKGETLIISIIHQEVILMILLPNIIGLDKN